MYIENILYLQDLDLVLKTDLSFLKNKNVFITGASGLVGSFLLDVLVRFNQHTDEKINIYATFSSEQSLFKRFSKEYCKNFNAIICDIIKPIQLDIKPDFVIHAASLTHPKMYAEKPVETMKTNILGTINILDWVRENHECRVCFLSTLEVYGENTSKEGIFKENDIGSFDFTLLRSCYPESKRVCETLTRCYTTEYNMQIMTARLGYVYGPTVQLNSSKADVQFLNNALNNEDIVMKSDGRQKRSYCYVADVVSGILTILSKGKAGEAYNIASREGNICLKKFAETIAELANVEILFECPTEIEKCGYSTVKNSTLDASKLEKLGWEPNIVLRDGIKRTLEIKKELENARKIER